MALQPNSTPNFLFFCGRKKGIVQSVLSFMQTAIANDFVATGEITHQTTHSN
jgi:hypothetical protein